MDGEGETSVRCLGEVLEDFERRGSFTPSGLSGALLSLESEYRRTRQAIPYEVSAEWIAFALDGKPTNQFGWDTYYAPDTAFPLKDGTLATVPELHEITSDVIGYWKIRATTARHPTMRARYADLVWEFCRLRKERVTIEFPRIVIAATIESVRDDRFEDHHAGFDRLKRALELALRLSDGPRATLVAEALVEYSERLPDGNRWWAVYDALIDSRRRPTIVPETVDRIIRGLEEQLASATTAFFREGANVAMPDPFPIQTPALRLAAYYRAERPNEMRRVLLVYGVVFRAASDRVRPLLASAWLKDVFQELRKFEFNDAARAILLRLEQLGPAVAQEFRDAPKRTVRVSMDQMREELTALTDGTLDEVLARITDEFMPFAEAWARIDRQEASRDFFDGLGASRVLTDWMGRTVAKVGSLEDDLPGRLLQELANVMMDQRMQLRLRLAIEWMIERLQPSVEDLLAYVMRGSMAFEPGRAPLLKNGLDAYLAGNAISAVPVLVPQIEHALRNTVAMADDGTYAFTTNKHSGLMLKTFDPLLEDAAVIQALTDEGVLYFKAVFTDQRGLNLRHNVCHGIVPAEQFKMGMADRVVHALLVLQRAGCRPAGSGGEGFFGAGSGAG